MMWKVKVTVVPVIIRTQEAVTPKLGEWLSLATFVCFSLCKGFLRDVVASRNRSSQCCCLSSTKAKADPYANLHISSQSVYCVISPCGKPALVLSFGK